MKLNWGTGIAISIVLFVGFIMYLVIQMTTNKEFNHDLVTEDYFKKEMELTSEFEAIKNATPYVDSIRVDNHEKGLAVSFPNSLINSVGTVLLKRPSNKKLDFNVAINLTELPTVIYIPKDKLIEGKWNLILNWSHNNQDFKLNKEHYYEAL